ncbi:PHD finger protein 20-like protein 1 isoform X1 [Xenopus laevis]|uniref:PHD finger protein 20-like protein 1 n=1 Tax=Xenopus laevis TaxID=8355 RepID=A0A8J0VKQ1_XENLA|nr:PHD finger protein 20-like protein 1 isoform X1 [Xenopus laevis]
MSETPPSRPGIAFEIGARLEAQDYLLKWYPSKIEKIDYEEEKLLIHFERWSSRYDEWIHWDSSRLRPLERPSLRKEGLRDDEENFDFKEGEEVLARWTDCRYYPAKIETINKEGTYTVQFYDGVIRCLKKMHIKSMPEDAKGQDWIALVKAAAVVAAKNKSGNKPRTSINSNKDKEEKKWSKGLSKKEEAVLSKTFGIFQKEEEEPTSSRNLGTPLTSSTDVALPETSRMSIEPQENELLLKRKLSQTSSFQAKRARLNKITGLLASKAVGLDEAEKKDRVSEKTSRPEEEISPKPQKQNEGAISHPCGTLKPALLPTALSAGKSRSRKNKRDPGDASGCKQIPMSPIAPDLTQGTSQPAALGKASGRKNRRRPQRSALPSSGDFPSPPFSNRKGLQSGPHTQQRLSVATVPADAPEKPEPLDLSHSTEPTAAPVPPESSIRVNCPSKEKENIQRKSSSSKAVADSSASASSASSPQVHALKSAVPNSVKPAKGTKKKKSCVSEGTENPPSAGASDKVSNNVQEKVIKKVNEKDKRSEVGVVKEKKVKIEEKPPSVGKKKDKDRKEKKEKEHSKSKQKKKKKKKKKSKQHEYSDLEEASMEYLDRSSPPVTLSSPGTLSVCNTLTVKNNSFPFPRAILSVDLTGENLSDMEFLDNSSTESLILSGDEYNQEFDSAIFEESQDEEEAVNEIVRCVCEMDEENGFMIQCEECLCWQHSACMGLLEESIPEQYVCYICTDPPGQRWSAKYRYDRDWFNKGHLCGLSFVNENYSYLNAKKIVSTHHLLADIFNVTEIMYGLQLKFGVLKNKEHPDLRLWACPGKQKEQGDLNEKRTFCTNQSDRTACGQNHIGFPSKLCKSDDTYITSEHSYQKLPIGDHDCNSTSEAAGCNDEAGATEKRETLGDTKTCLQGSLKTERKSEQNVVEENKVSHERRGAEEQVDSHVQWQLNLLAHIENVQNEVSSRMDLIEKEVDVLESWLDFTGELEPPDPLGRLPQLKRRMKQLLMDMGKVQQIAAVCSV